ncbi:ATP-binding protein [Streptomyces sp. NPDC003077]|uniref:ATP-binding protein n=1 Tax=Streptomyces sp. NPDC003077 TaxID=3154443 RepID=UPI0033AAA00D
MNALTPRPPSAWRFTRHPRSVGRARKLLREQAGAWDLPPDTTVTAALLLSELLTNACAHAHVSPEREIHVSCSLRTGVLRVEVSDTAVEQPELRDPDDGDEDAEDAWGLALVTALADDWGGVRPRPYRTGTGTGTGTGKTVWFALSVVTPDGGPSPTASVRGDWTAGVS